MEIDKQKPIATIEINDLPYPPSVNHIYGYNSRNKTKFLNKRAQDFVWLVKAAVNNQVSFAQMPLNGRLHVTVYAYPPSTKRRSSKLRRDVDNILKILFDSLTYSGIFGDDEQVDRLLVERRTPLKKGKVDLVIHEYPKLKLTKRPRGPRKSDA